MRYFESHAHYDDGRFGKDLPSVINACKEAGVEYIINAGADLSSSKKGIKLAAQYDFIYATIGVHPHSAKTLSEDSFCDLENLVKSPKVVAIGEIGLDFHYDHSPRDIQKKWFIRQMELAKACNLPAIIHSREASEETFNIVKNANLSDREGLGAGVVHCYSGSYEMAVKYAELGYFIGIAGPVTYKNAKKLVETVKKIPIERILIETDCPYLSPEPFRGKRNDSQNLKYICEKISEIKQITVEKTAEITLENGKKLFDIK
ncbi:MAG: TatD family hydrolase [Defluviitaleaceae bacterium]|nr:TatD family hydrolase [Defluviitaleaceae bacterium]